MNDSTPDSTLVLPTSPLSGITPEPLHVAGAVGPARRLVKWPIHSFDFALAATIGLVMAGAGVISVINAVAH